MFPILLNFLLLTSFLAEAFAWPSLLGRKSICASPSTALMVQDEVFSTSTDDVGLSGDGVTSYLAVHAILHEKYEQILKKQNQTSSCFELSRSRLFAGCKRFHSKDVDIEGLKSAYGIALGICELQESGFITPTSCESIAAEGDYQLPQLQKCLAAIVRKPQSWTSYSNHRKDADIICEVGREPLKLAEAHSTFHKMLKDMRAVVEVFPGLNTYLQEIDRKASEVFSNLHSIFDVAINARESIDLLDRDLDTVRANSHEINGSLLGSLALAQASNEHNARNLALAEQLGEQIIGAGLAQRRQVEQWRGVFEGFVRLSQAHIEEVTRNVSHIMLDGTKEFQQRLSEHNLRIRRQQIFDILAQYMQWWLQGEWPSSAWKYLRPVIHSHPNFAAGFFLVVFPSICLFAKPSLVLDLQAFILRCGPRIMTTASASLALGALASSAYNRFTAFRTARVRQSNQLKSAAAEKAFSTRTREMTSRPNGWSTNPDRSFQKGNKTGTPLRLELMMPRKSSIRSDRAASLEPESCSYFSTGEI